MEEQIFSQAYIPQHLEQVMLVLATPKNVT